KAHGTNTHNLSPNATGLDAFGQSPLADFMVHYKGNKKNNIQSDGISPDVNGPKRYGQLLTLIKHYNPKSVIETGTWNGGRAIQMAEAAFLNQDEFTYTGFDLFEDASAETDELELNTKQHNSLENVTQRLETYREKKAQEGKTFYFELIKGNTNVTLKNKKYSADVAYLDGGHSIETVKNDYENIEADVVIFNSFFSEDKEGKKPDERHCGTNTVVQEIIDGIKNEQLKYRVKILPSSDGVLNGGYAHLAVILKNDESKDIPDEFRKVPIVITPKDCMPDDYIINNINENLKLVKDDNWVKTCGLTEDKLIIVSGGDVDYVDLKNTIDKFKKSGHNFKIACVKHAYP
ncbi:MAG: class I SAM-dependent methyltransferase, partial [Pelagibacteraceae bacterium]